MAIEDFPPNQWTFTVRCAHKDPCHTDTQDAMGFESKAEAMDKGIRIIEEMSALKLVHRPLLSGTDDWYEIFYAFDVMYSPMPVQVVFVHQFKTTVDQIDKRVFQRTNDKRIVDALNAQFTSQ